MKHNSTLYQIAISYYEFKRIASVYELRTREEVVRLNN